ncbi:MAG: EAL domain-containing protein [Candidatus Thiodiazotropha sp.]
MAFDAPPNAISFSRSLRARFIFWIGIVLLLTLGGAAYYVYSAQQTLLANSLQSKVVALGRFIALISPDAIYTFDITMLDRYVKQITEDEDVLFAQIRSPSGTPMTTYLPPGITREQVKVWIETIDETQDPQRLTVDKVIFYSFSIVANGEELGHVLVGLDTQPMQAHTRQVLVDLIKIFSAIVISLGVLIFMIFKWHVLDPVGRLKTAAMRVSEGDFTHQVEVQQHDELGHLATCFNSMMDEINIDREALISSNQRLAEEIHQRQLANVELTKLSLAVEQSPASVVITDLEGHVEYVNPRFCEVSGYYRDEVIGKQIPMFGNETQEPQERQRIITQLSQGDLWRGEFRNQRKNGEEYWESAVLAPIRDDQGVITHYLAVKEDISERKAFEETLVEQATHDQLTGLPNRFLAMDRLQQLMQHAMREKNKIAVIYIDLDNFKMVNDSLGHATGDGLLVQVANRIWAQLRDEDTLSRLGGDEFMALVPNLKNPAEDLQIILDRLIASVKIPFEVYESEINVTSSMGISLFPDDGESVGMLMSNADIAMYEAKRSGRNTFRFFTREMNEQVREKMALESRLRHALEEGELYPVYQPVIRLSDGAVVGAETLLRWHNPEMGDITPAEFIPIAEQFGLIRPITDWLLQRIMTDAREWKGRPEEFWIAVNVPPIYFCEDAFRDALSGTLQQAVEQGITLCVEITENLFLQNDKTALNVFQDLRALGVSSAVDDFGTGYSSLAYLKQFPLDFLKIDRAFVDGLPENPDDQSLTEAIVLMGHRLGIRIIAEGVENAVQLEYLRNLKVEYAQGYHIAKPMNQSVFLDYLMTLGRGSPDL